MLMHRAWDIWVIYAIAGIQKWNHQVALMMPLSFLVCFSPESPQTCQAEWTRSCRLCPLALWVIRSLSARIISSTASRLVHQLCIKCCSCILYIYIPLKVKALYIWDPEKLQCRKKAAFKIFVNPLCCDAKYVQKVSIRAPKCSCKNYVRDVTSQKLMNVCNDNIVNFRETVS